MKKYFILLLSLSILTTSCKDDDNTPVAYNETDGKQALEDNTIEVLETIQNFRNDSSLAEVEEFLNIITSNFEEEEENNIVVTQAKRALAFAQQANNLSSDKLSINIYEDTEPIYYEEDEDISLEDEYNDLLGLYTWNESINDFDYTESDDNNIVVSVTSDNKTAILTISNFSTTTLDGEELPESINTTLKIDDTDIMSMSHSLELDNDTDLPSSMSQTATFGTMSYSLNLNTNDDSVSFVESMSIGDLNILSINSTINGIDDISNDDLGDISISTNTSVSLGKTTLSINGSTPEEINEEDVEDEQKALDLLNDSVSITVSSGNTKVADGEFFLIEETYNDYVYNYSSGEYEEIIVTESDLDLRMVFDDGSKADLESYFSVGFEDIEKHIEETFEVYTEILE